ncbi:FMN-dependent NADH-azoreductase [Mesonia aestuariivivens]|uniref:FMN dependent NADH:quinone oxidoreductase n=1 Tax=Mesonia aestuariivivens TaxID=2796128 RepID=A0ABS6W3A0_9FLAO|nr:NAD(P)H-dependent oxidoreductase [Mesonia aestuariivivens]MBW2962333.1 NAD(P)H-dependent oxidoreductase [Mesonia aestuariivivens]
MKNILHVLASPLGENSFSIKLGNEIVEKLTSKYPEAKVEEYNLIQKEFQHLDGEILGAFASATPEELNERQKKALALSQEAIQKIEEADILVVGAPLYNFGIHSLQKNWLDYVCRAGVTFRYTEDGPEGLMKGKKAYIAMSSGGVYSEGAMKEVDFVAPYLNTVFNFIGIEDVTTYRVEGVAIPELKETALEKAVEAAVI